jgi:hypothetical protein
MMLTVQQFEKRYYKHKFSIKKFAVRWKYTNFTQK